MHFAHSRPGEPIADWEPLQDHLELVGDVAESFAAAIGFPEWGRLLGLWHDLGKFSIEFQAYLRKAGEKTGTGSKGTERVDHSSAGAQHAVQLLDRGVGQIIAYAIAGHHAGLPDFEDSGGGVGGLKQRLSKQIPNWLHAPTSILNQRPPPKPALDWKNTPDLDPAFGLSVFTRMLFSCLVDADYLATEAFLNPDKQAARLTASPSPAALLSLLEVHLARLQARAPSNSVNTIRSNVLQQCMAKAELPPGFFSLTVPTGGGKTLSSLAFALKHAADFDLRRVIYAIPYTSIIEQNAKVFRDALKEAGNGVVLEHHSNFDSHDNRENDSEQEAQTPWDRLAAENWDAPLVVTTNVQLFESLLANRPSRCRKLHRVARSVIILDECQSLPVVLLAPTLRMLSELVHNYGCTVVLCTATQPAVTERAGFPLGLRNVREIMPDPQKLQESLRRVEVRPLGKLTDEELAENLKAHEQVLCIVNTRDHAAKLFDMADSDSPPDSTFHLSASMCARHRSSVLRLIRQRLKRKLPCRVVSTQLIEAGVDIDFPVVFRAMTGLDSLAQAAGRCNREGRLSRGQVFVFESDVDPRGELRMRRQAGSEVAGLHPAEDWLSLQALQHYFELHYWKRKDEWDQKGILSRFRASGEGLTFQFREVAERFQMIDDTQEAVIVPYGRRGRMLIHELRYSYAPPGRAFARRAQRYVVGVPMYKFMKLYEDGAVTQYHERYWVLETQELYGSRVGLQGESSVNNPERWIF